MVKINDIWAMDERGSFEVIGDVHSEWDIIFLMEKRVLFDWIMEMLQPFLVFLILCCCFFSSKLFIQHINDNH